MHSFSWHQRGFSLIELMVSITLIGILAAVVTVNYSASRAKVRDAQRQTDLRLLQAAITQYRQENGRYPEGCNAAGEWSGGTYTCADPDEEYIVGLAPKYIGRLPEDPNIGTGSGQAVNRGYVYTTNTDGTVYKLMAMNTVENDVLTYTHPLKSCDVKPSEGGTFPASTNITTYGWCVSVHNSVDGAPQPRQCKKNGDDGSNGRFSSSYGIWGGFANNGSTTPTFVRDTAIIICK
jgi:prepilin-type N-terminal cleavage/methylation domain-containing protein